MKYEKMTEYILEGEEDLISFGIPMNLNGFVYLCDAIAFGLEREEMLSLLSKGLYEKIAQKEHVTAGGVETGIRRAIDVAWKSGRLQTALNELTGGMYERKPTNGEFISFLIWRLQKKFNIPQLGFANPHPLLRSVNSSSFVAHPDSCYNEATTEEAINDGNHRKGNTEN